MLTLNRSLLNREYNLMNVLKALAFIVSICNLHVILLSNITPRYFTLFTNGMFWPFNVRRESPLAILSQSQSHFSTNSQSASTSWCQAHSWAFDQKFVFV
jgi:hypothetical protein